MQISGDEGRFSHAADSISSELSKLPLLTGKFSNRHKDV